VLAKKGQLITITIMAGIAVVASYIIGFLRVPTASEILWGGVPAFLRPIYTINMCLATAGFFAFTHFILFRLDSANTTLFGIPGFGLFNLVYLAILVPSALWLPLTFSAVAQSSPGLLWVVRATLAVVGLASLGLFIILCRIKPRQHGWAYRLALAGCVFFCLQTIILDALVWGCLFKI
jgi:hypothetical protein